MVAWYSSRSFKQFYLTKTTENLRCCALMATEIMAEKFSTYDSHKINALCKKINLETSFNITVILPSGLVLGDSGEEPDRMDNLADRPEGKKSLPGMVNTCTSYSHTLKKEMIYNC